MIRIVNATEPISVESIVLMIYGQPGIGKTSIAFTSEAPLCLDFDKGSHRSKFRKDSVSASSWDDTKDLSEEDLALYQTIVVDTVGRALEALSREIIRSNPKMGQADGALTIQGYGSLKARFAAWLSTLRSFGKDVILVAHEKEDKKGDDLIVRPDITGGSYGEVFRSADAVGYANIVNRKPVLHFCASDDILAKGPRTLGDIAIPNLEQDPTFCARIIDEIKGELGKMSESSAEAKKRVEEIRVVVESAQNPEALTQLVTELKAAEPKPVWLQCKTMIWDKSQELGYEFADGKFVEAEHAA